MTQETDSLSIARPLYLLALVIFLSISLALLLIGYLSEREIHSYENADKRHHEKIVQTLELAEEINHARLRLWGAHPDYLLHTGSAPGDLHGHLFDLPAGEVLPHVAQHISDLAKDIEHGKSHFASEAFHPLSRKFQTEVNKVSKQLTEIELKSLSVEIYDDIVRNLHETIHELLLQHSSYYPVAMASFHDLQREIFRFKVIIGLLVVLLSLIAVFVVARRVEWLAKERIEAEKKYEAVLREERDLSRAVLDTAHALIIVGDIEGNIEQFNVKCQEVTLYSENEVLGKPVAELLFPGEEEKIRDILKEIASGHGKEWYKLWLTTKSREKRLIDWSSTLIKDEAGNPDKIVGIGLDITEKQMIQDQLIASENSLNQAQEISNTGNWVWDIITNDLHWSDQIYRILGLEKSPAPATYDDFVRVTHPDDRERMSSVVAAVVADPDLIYDAEHRIIRPDGEIRHVHEQGEVIRDKEGAPIKMIGTVQDITTQIQASERIAAQARIIDQVHDSVVSTDLDGIITSWNKGAERIFGYSEEEALGKYVGMLYAEDQQDCLADEIIAPLLQKKQHEVEITMIRKNGESFVGHLSLSMQKDSTGREVGMIGYTMDITDRKLAEQALAESEKRFRMINSRIPGIVYQFRIDAEGKRSLPYVTPTVEEFIGLSDEVVMKDVEKWFALAYPDDLAELEASIERSLDSMSVWKWEGRFVRPDGEVRWFIGSSVPSRQEDGSVVWDGVFTDITERKQAENELQQTTQLLDGIVENVPNMIFLKNASDLSFEFFNRAGEELLGVRREQLLGKSDYDFFPKEQADSLVAEDRKVLDQQGMLDVPQEPIDTPAGERILHTQKIALRDEAGTPRYLLGISEDITERLQADIALKDSLSEKEVLLGQLRYERDYAERLVNAAPVIVLLLDSAGYIQHANPYFEKLTGYKLDEIKGKEWFSTFLPEKDQDSVRTLFHEAVEGLYVEGNINSIVTRGGEERQIEWYARTIFDDKGDMAGLISVGQDITDRLEADKDLQRFKYTLDRTLDCVYMFDAKNLRFFYVNEGAMRQTGHDFEEMLDMHPYDIKPTYTETQFRELLQPLLRGEEESCSYETIHRSKDGKDIPVSIFLQYFESDVAAPNFIAIVHDITERQEADNAMKRSLAEKEVLIRELHHRVKNILQVISSLINMQSRQIGDEKSKEAFMETRDRIRAVALIYEKLFGESNLSEIDVKRYIEYIVSRLDSAYGASKRGIETKVSGEPMVLSMEKAMPCGLIVNELVTNVYKHAFEEGAPGAVTVDVAIDDKNDCNICIIDNGTGIENRSIAEDSFGLKIIDTLAKQIDGEIAISGTDGTIAKLTFKC